VSTGFDIALPESWSWSPIKFTVTFLNRGTAPDYVDDGPVRAISQAANQASGLDWERTRFHNCSGDPRKLKGYLIPDDVLINSTGNGTLGRVGYFTAGPDDLPCIADGHVTVVRTDRDVADPRFMFYWLSSTPFQDYINSALIVGATNQIELNRERLAGSPIGLPPIDEQRRIANFLDSETARIDGLISSSKRQRELSEQMFKEILRIRTTTTGDGGRATGIDWIPRVDRSWPLLKVAHQFRTGSGTTPPSSESRFYDGPHPWINSGDLNDGIIQTVRSSVTDGALQEFSALKLHPPGSLVIAMYGQGATKGKVGLIRERATVNQACCVLFPIGNISAEFALFWFRAHKEAIVAMAYGAGQPNLSQELIRQLKIPTPDPSAQGQIVSELTSQEAELRQRTEALENREKLLSERRQALITAAVIGQIDVTTAREVDTSGLSSDGGVSI
jgi:type I restriction enzyme, S subunit